MVLEHDVPGIVMAEYAVTALEDRKFVSLYVDLQYVDAVQTNGIESRGLHLDLG